MVADLERIVRNTGSWEKNNSDRLTPAKPICLAFPGRGCRAFLKEDAASGGAWLGVPSRAVHVARASTRVRLMRTKINSQQWSHLYFVFMLH
jgi:hypothetical protein